MEITSDYSLTKLFITKEVKIFIDKKFAFTIKLKTIRDFYLDQDWNAFYNIISMSDESFSKTIGLKETKRSWDLISFFLNELGMYDRFRSINDIFQKEINDLFDNVEWKRPQLLINGISMTNEIWEYVTYLLKLSYGEKVDKPLTFASEEARKFYLAQKAAEDKIRKIKSGNGDKDGLIKAMLSIVYKFPSFTFDYLFNQTMAQIQWLQKLSAGALSYEVNAQAFAAGNVKKGKKLDFFIK